MSEVIEQVEVEEEKPQRYQWNQVPKLRDFTFAKDENGNPLTHSGDNRRNRRMKIYGNRRDEHKYDYVCAPGKRRELIIFVPKKYVLGE